MDNGQTATKESKKTKNTYYIITFYLHPSLIEIHQHIYFFWIY